MAPGTAPSSASLISPSSGCPECDDPASYADSEVVIVGAVRRWNFGASGATRAQALRRVATPRTRRSATLASAAGGWARRLEGSRRRRRRDVLWRRGDLMRPLGEGRGEDCPDRCCARDPRWGSHDHLAGCHRGGQGRRVGTAPSSTSMRHADTGNIEFGSPIGHGQPMRCLIESGAARGWFLQVGCAATGRHRRSRTGWPNSGCARSR